MDGVGGAAATQEYERELEVKNQKIRELEEELAVSKRLTTDFMLNMNRAKQQLRKYVEQPVIMWSDDCECKQQVLAVAGLLKKFITMERNTNNSKPGSSSRRNTKVDGESRQKQIAGRGIVPVLMSRRQRAVRISRGIREEDCACE
jgi:hypothetical protein